MTMEPTREEWMAARGRIEKADPTGWPSRVDILTEAALGPCPPEPAPKDAVLRVYNVDCVGRDLAVCIRGDMVALGLEHPSLFMDAETAESVADALRVCAQWLREHGGQS